MKRKDFNTLGNITADQKTGGEAGMDYVGLRFVHILSEDINFLWLLIVG